VDERFLQAWFPARVRVTGRKLKPFSLAHWLRLAAIDSPFLSEKKEVVVADLVLAARICSGNPFQGDPQRPSIRDRIVAGVATRNPIYFRREASRFVAYLDQGCQGPKYWEDKENAVHREKVPWILSVATNLLRGTSLSETAVWSMPVGRALWYNATLALQEGAKLDILSTEDERLLDELAKEGWKP